ncbi:MAG: hypothetical protein GWO08_22320, partial [Gammaproteobacteria bacterium]|nr:hypothetical protein [Gammaproteobacteria bacterium]NIR65320.1 hypothetical protein [candidate division Zixibacteria bacterium]NIW99680.1 hypothetical protein [Phycisphaerae bacterium]NIR25712.1 hypothetical protein [Gammaproteobacteria bacterium]NIR96270.1 hypothetical protein [Gammaproteobacteria bacterium]
AGIGTGEGEGKLAVNTFHAMLRELANAEMTKQDIIDYWSLDAGEQTELDWVIAQYNAQPNAEAKDKFILLM